MSCRPAAMRSSCGWPIVRSPASASATSTSNRPSRCSMRKENPAEWRGFLFFQQLRCFGFGRVSVWLNPADSIVTAAVNHVNVMGLRVHEDEEVGMHQIHLHHGFIYRHGLQVAHLL